MQKIWHVNQKKKNKRLLLITSSGGGGHLQAAQAQRLKALSEDPTTEILQKDILIDWVGRRFGKGFVLLWNASQKRGNLSLLSFLSKNIPSADFFFYLHIFSRVLYAIIKEDIDQVIDTQPIGTSSIIQAIKWARKITRKPLKLEKIVTELPTDQVLHFFKPIKSLNPNNRTFLKLISTNPLLNPNQTADAFWQKNCGLSEREVSYESLPLRPAFKKFQNIQPLITKHVDIEIQVHSNEEKSLIADTIKLGQLHAEIHKHKIVITIAPQDKVSTILLGSQPAAEATLKYVQHYIEMVKKYGGHERHLLFVFCNSHTGHKNSLLKRVHDLIQKTIDYPLALNIIPMCFQEDDVIASLYYRSNATFTRSGGLTSMELMSVAQGQIWIHSEVKKPNNHQKKVCKGMPIWEWGNAIYLQKKKGACFIHPETFVEVCKPYFLPPLGNNLKLIHTASRALNSSRVKKIT